MFVVTFSLRLDMHLALETYWEWRCSFTRSYLLRLFPAGWKSYGEEKDLFTANGTPIPRPSDP
jgi:hypothetical protein